MVTLSLLVYDLVITINVLTVLPTFLSDSLTGCDRGGRKRAGSTSNQGNVSLFGILISGIVVARFSSGYLFTSYRPWSHYLLYMRRPNLPGTCIAPPFLTKVQFQLSPSRYVHSVRVQKPSLRPCLASGGPRPHAVWVLFLKVRHADRPQLLGGSVAWEILADSSSGTVYGVLRALYN